MTSPREAFLERVRRAVAEGNRAGRVAALEARGDVGYQGAGADPAARFCQEFTAAGGHAHRVADREAARAEVLDILRRCGARRVLLGRGAVPDTLNLDEALRGAGLEPVRVEEMPAEQCRDAFFQADAGVTGVDFLVAETGSLVLLSRPEQPRSLSLLPPVHVAVAERSQIVPDLFDLFKGRPETPSCLTLITGPSKTGDIELRLVTGVHGPGEVHLVLLDVL